MWRSKWSSVINAGLRALVNLMPGDYEGNQVLNVLAADPWTKDDLNTTCSYTAATLRKMEGEGHIKWKHLQAIAVVLENTKTGSLSRFIPEATPLKVYTASDSVLTMYNKVVTRSWETMWNECRQIWSKHISQAHFSVNDGAMITGICEGLLNMLSQVEPNRGNPISFSDQITLISTMNEKRGGAEDTFAKVRDELEKFAVGTVIILGPADADLWWPDCVGSASSETWTRRSYTYFEALISGKHPYIRGSAPLKQLEIRSWLSKKGRQCYDHHFQDTTSNIAKMTQILTNLAALNQMLGILYEVAWQIGLLPGEAAFTPTWIANYPGLGQNLQEEETPGSRH